MNSSDRFATAEGEVPRGEGMDEWCRQRPAGGGGQGSGAAPSRGSPPARFDHSLTFTVLLGRLNYAALCTRGQTLPRLAQPAHSSGATSATASRCQEFGASRALLARSCQTTVAAHRRLLPLPATCRLPPSVHCRHGAACGHRRLGCRGECSGRCSRVTASANTQSLLLGRCCTVAATSLRRSALAALPPAVQNIAQKNVKAICEADNCEGERAAGRRTVN